MKYKNNVQWIFVIWNVLLLLKNNSVLFNTFEISHFQISMWTKINSEFLYLSEPDCAYLYPQGNLNQKTCLHKNWRIKTTAATTNKVQKEMMLTKTKEAKSEK